jgi:hypothetical protein
MRKHQGSGDCAMTVVTRPNPAAKKTKQTNKQTNKQKKQKKREASIGSKVTGHEKQVNKCRA